MSGFMFDSEGYRRRETVARTSAVAYLAIGALMLLSLAPPHADPTEPWLLAGAGGAALVLSILTWVAGRRLPRLFQHAVMALVTATITVAVFAGGVALGGTLAALYAILLAIAATFSRSRAIGFHLLWAIGTLGAVVAFGDGEQVGASQWIVASGAVGAVTAVVAWLAGRARSLTVTDPVTGVHNRRYWETALPNELARARRRHEPLAVALIGLDRLDEVAESAGPIGSDLVLAHFATLLRERVRRVDLLARVRGDVFGVILPTRTVGQTQALIDRVAQAQPPPPTVSVAVVSWDGEESASDLVDRAMDDLDAVRQERARERIGDAEADPA